MYVDRLDMKTDDLDIQVESNNIFYQLCFMFCLPTYTAFVVDAPGNKTPFK